jgi:hypothetical protein
MKDDQLIEDASIDRQLHTNMTEMNLNDNTVSQVTMITQNNMVTEPTNSQSLVVLQHSNTKMPL